MTPSFPSQEYWIPLFSNINCKVATKFSIFWCQADNVVNVDFSSYVSLLHSFTVCLHWSNLPHSWDNIMRGIENHCLDDLTLIPIQFDYFLVGDATCTVFTQIMCFHLFNLPQRHTNIMHSIDKHYLDGLSLIPTMLDSFLVGDATCSVLILISAQCWGENSWIKQSGTYYTLVMMVSWYFPMYDIHWPAYCSSFCQNHALVYRIPSWFLLVWKSSGYNNFLL
jgi:hypothetical protein